MGAEPRPCSSLHGRVSVFPVSPLQVKPFAGDVRTHIDMYVSRSFTCLDVQGCLFFLRTVAAKQRLGPFLALAQCIWHQGSICFKGLGFRGQKGFFSMALLFMMSFF